jgi:DNA-binding transcriptional regulator YiaG
VKVEMMTELCPKCGAPWRVFNGQSLRKAREKTSISLREMARRLNVSAAYLSDVERNRRRVTDAVLKGYWGAL